MVRDVRGGYLRSATNGDVKADIQAHIGAGVRYNAQKKKVGNYYSTPIYGFRCKCHLCSGWFEIRTDPKVSNTRLHTLLCDDGR